MFISSTYRHCGISSTQVVARKHVRMYLRKIREREYLKLRALIPTVASKKKVTKVQVIEEAVRYIEKLHAALIERFREKHGCMAEGKAQETVRTFVSRMMNHQRSFKEGVTNHSASTVTTSPRSYKKQKKQPYILIRRKNVS